MHARSSIVSGVRFTTAAIAHRRGKRNQAAVVVGLVAFAISLAGSWIPSYWSDEVATLRASRLSWLELFSFVEHKDAVHVAYYSVMKVWVSGFGESELATRSVSALAVGAAAGGLVILASTMTLRVGVLAGVIFAVLPRTTAMGIEARSFALSAAFAVWITVVLLVAVRAQGWRWWALYAFGVAAGTYFFLYSVLILAAHIVFLLLDHRARAVLMSWLLAASAAVAMTVPIIVISVQQREQIAWLSELPVVTVWTVLGKPVFDSSWLVAAIAWCALLILAIRCRTIWSGLHGSSFRLAAAWLSVPVVLLLAADIVVGPLYTARYLSFIVPAAAVLLAVSFTLASRASISWLLVCVVALASAPTYVVQRGPFAKDAGSDLAEIADYIHSNARAGDGIYLQDTGRSTLRPRLALYAYPEAFTDTDDIAFKAPFTSTGTFSDQTRSLDEIEPRLAALNRFWVITAGSPDSAIAQETGEAVHMMGLFEAKLHTTNRSTIVLYER